MTRHPRTSSSISSTRELSPPPGPITSSSISTASRFGDNRAAGRHLLPWPRGDPAPRVGHRVSTQVTNHSPHHAGKPRRVGREFSEARPDPSGSVAAVARRALLGPSWLDANDLCALPRRRLCRHQLLLPRTGRPSERAFAGGISAAMVLEWRNRDDGWSHRRGDRPQLSPTALRSRPAEMPISWRRWGTKKLARIPRADARGSLTRVPLNGLIDNITWTHDGRLLCCCPNWSTWPTSMRASKARSDASRAPFRGSKDRPPSTSNTKVLAAPECARSFSQPRFFRSATTANMVASSGRCQSADHLEF